MPSATANPSTLLPPKPGIWSAIKETATQFSDDDGMTQAAALAFYTGLSLAPLLSIAVWLTQVFVGTSQAATDQIVAVATQVIGAQAAAPIKELIGPAASGSKTGLTGLISLGFLAFTASGVFAQLQSSLNIMWNVKTDPTGSGWVSLLRKRLFSFGMLFTLLFLMLVSMVASFVLEAVQTYIKARFGGDGGEQGPLVLGLQGVNLLLTLVVATGVFALLFKYLPDVKVSWRDTLVGSAITSVLFLIGKFGLAVYLGRGSYETSYGAAIGSFVALLVWVYYTSTIIFVGAEATQVYARRQGHAAQPEEHAVKTERTEEIITTPAPAHPTTYTATRPVRPSI